MLNTLSLLFVGGCCLLAGASAAEKKSEAFAFYLDYLETAAKAETLAEIEPFMPSWWKDRYAAADEATQASTLKRIGDSARDLREVQLEKEEAADEGVRLHMTAREKNDLPMRGKVLLGRESGAFTVEESFWATSR